MSDVFSGQCGNPICQKNGNNTGGAALGKLFTISLVIVGHRSDVNGLESRAGAISQRDAHAHRAEKGKMSVIRR